MIGWAIHRELKTGNSRLDYSTGVGGGAEGWSAGHQEAGGVPGGVEGQTGNRATHHSCQTLGAGVI